MARIYGITGVAGFIGSNLANLLLSAGKTIVGLDSLVAGSRQNVDSLQATYGDRFQFVEGDIRDSDRVSQAVSKAECVVHLAAQISVPSSIENPELTHSVNVDGFQCVLDGARLAGVSRFIYASSSAVYGDNPVMPLCESAAMAPMSPYAESKLANEIAAEKVSTASFATTGLRFFNVYGPRQPDTGGYAAVIPKWIAAIQAGERPVVYGDGSATRDFVHVSDVCAVIHALSERRDPAPALVYNVGSGLPCRLDVLYQTIEKAFLDMDCAVTGGVPIRKPWRDGDILHSCANVDLIHRDLSLDPFTSLNDGIRDLVERKIAA